VSGERPVILVVDDSSDLLALTTRMLADDYEVLTAEDAGTRSSWRPALRVRT